MSEEYGNDYITLIDEDGNEREYEHVETIELDGNSYVALIPAYESPEELIDSDGNFLILKIVEEENGEEVLVSIDDEEEFGKVLAEFERIFEDDYTIES